MSGTKKLHLCFQQHLSPPCGEQNLKCLYFVNRLTNLKFFFVEHICELQEPKNMGYKTPEFRLKYNGMTQMHLNFTANCFVIECINRENAPRTFFANLASTELAKCIRTSWQAALFLDP